MKKIAEIVLPVLLGCLLALLGRAITMHLAFAGGSSYSGPLPPWIQGPPTTDPVDPTLDDWQKVCPASTGFIAHSGENLGVVRLLRGVGPWPNPDLCEAHQALIPTYGTVPTSAANAAAILVTPLPARSFTLPAVTLTDGSAVTVTQISCPSGAAASGAVNFTVLVANATDSQTGTFSQTYNVSNKSGTITASLGNPQNVSADGSLAGSTLTMLATATTNTAGIVIQLTVHSNLSSVTSEQCSPVVTVVGSAGSVAQ